MHSFLFAARQRALGLGGGTATFEEIPVDAFAAKLNASGSRLVYSTYLGGSGADVGTGGCAGRQRQRVLHRLLRIARASDHRGCPQAVLRDAGARAQRVVTKLNRGVSAPDEA
jgi:hypothetical protein